ncbi:serine hydrolase [uncultured Brevibacillus sp.]|uniref:serine hydrolase domain-containing protein n=1 Tax=uncultured Brevibacillus sp. TaxID=169970 RepID=UPI00259348B3|nr:serine hydrolase domain-containing protein [uncultured Brevibacillus sp.]
MSNIKWTEAFEESIGNLLGETKTPGAIVALAKDGELAYQQTFGYSDVEQQKEITLDTVFGIGSVTKSYTCAAIMHLQDAGKLSIHDPVIKYLLEFRTPDEKQTKQITIHHLMTHSAGLPPLPTLTFAMKKSLEADSVLQQSTLGAIFNKQLAKHDALETYEDVMKFIANYNFQLLGKPGEYFSYSNDSYGLLSAIINKVSGKPFEVYLKESILDPAGMTNTVFHLEELQSHTDTATLYSSEGFGAEKKVFASPAPWDAPLMRAAGFLKSTARDQLKYLEMFRTGGLVDGKRILSEASVSQMISPYIQLSPNMFYGYGFDVIKDFHGATLVEHGGNIKGVSAVIYLVPEHNITGVVLSNLHEAPSSTIMVAALNGIQSRPINTPSISYQVQELPADQLAQYEGAYAGGEGAEPFRFKAENGSVVMEGNGGAYEVSYVGGDCFTLEKDGRKLPIVFHRNDAGNMKGVFFGFRHFSKVE